MSAQSRPCPICGVEEGQLHRLEACLSPQQPQERSGESPFCTSHPMMQKIWDNSSLALYKACPEKYRLAILEGWRPKKEKPALTFGSLYHKALEIFDLDRAGGHDFQPALQAAVRYCLESTAEPTWEFRDLSGAIIARTPRLGNFAEEPKFPDAPRLEPGEYTITRGISFWTPDDKVRSRRTLVQAIIFYTAQYEQDAAQTLTLASGKPALELGFRIALPIQSPDGDSYLYCGNLDKLVELGANKYVLERKHTTATLSSHYFAQWSPNGQVSGYTFAGGAAFDVPLAGVIIDCGQIAVGFSRFGRGVVLRTPAQMEEWLRDTMHWIKRAEESAITGYYPKNEESCGNYGGCQYRGICSKDPSVRLNFLAADFKRDPWNPLKETPS